MARQNYATLQAKINKEIEKLHKQAQSLQSKQRKPVISQIVRSMKEYEISPEELAEQIVYVIDQPWGISISDITVRASGDQYLS